MSIYVSDTSGSQWTVVHDEMGHTGQVDPATITHPTNMDGSENHLMLIVPCPVCDAVSTHPVGGGAQPQAVQQMFVAKAELHGCPCGAITGPDNSGAPEAHVRLNCNRLDGPGRWQLG